MKKYHFQENNMDCGIACLSTIANFYNLDYTYNDILEKSELKEDGISLEDLSKTANEIGFTTQLIYAEYESFKKLSSFPLIVFLNYNHYVVVFSCRKNVISLFDPSTGVRKLNKSSFEDIWFLKGDKKGVVMLLQHKDKTQIKDTPFNFLKSYLIDYKKSIIWLVLVVGISATFQFLAPFLNKISIDEGVIKNEYNVVLYMFFAQITIVIVSAFLEYLRGKLIVYVSSNFLIKIVSGFLDKIFQLPLNFFHNNKIGDLLQRISDFSRLEILLTNTFVTLFFSILSVTILSISLLIINWQIFLIFFSFTALYFVWIFYFLKSRREIDYQNFKLLSENNEMLIDIIHGAQDLILNQAQSYKKNEWHEHQRKIYKMNFQLLKLDQKQSIGSYFINEIKNIIIIMYGSIKVIEGDFTFGDLMLISFVLGAVNKPISQFLLLFQSLQDAKISTERISEIVNISNTDDTISNDITCIESIVFDDVHFEMNNITILKGLNFALKIGEKNAIIGLSGSGKTSIIRLLMGVYKPTKGSIYINGIDLNEISKITYRSMIGVVLQNGYLFKDSISNNITLKNELNLQESKRLSEIVDLLGLKEIVNREIQDIDFKIDNSTTKLSGGQRQKVLLARMIFKDKEMYCLDEATSALDNATEMNVNNEIYKYLNQKTLIFVTHRIDMLNDFKNIIVLNNGEVAEVGSFDELCKSKGMFWHLYNIN